MNRVRTKWVSTQPNLLQCGQNDDPDKSAGGKQLAMGKVDQLDDAVNHGIAQGNQGINTSQEDGVDHLLNHKCGHCPW